MILKKVEGRRNPRAWHGSRFTVSGLHGHLSTPNPRPKRRVETPGDPWGVPQPPGPSSPAYGTPPTANRWFLPLSSSQWGQTLPTTSVMFPVRIEPRGHAQGGKKIPGFFCSSVSVVLFDTPGISRCRSQHVSVESSSLLHHSIYL